MDARLPQIATLSTLAAASATLGDFGTSAPQVAASVATAMAAQGVAALARGRRLDPLSALVTGLSLSILLRSSEPAVWVMAPVVGIAAKEVARANGKHLFNPACIGIVAAISLTDAAWVSPGQWGTAAWLVALVACAAAVVLSKAARWDTALAFAGSYAVMLAGRAWTLGDPATIPLHQVQSGSLLIFACFMVTDPRSTPDARAGRIAFAMAVAAVGYWLQFHMQVRPGLFYALALCAPLTPLLDLAMPARRFEWTGVKETRTKELAA